MGVISNIIDLVKGAKATGDSVADGLNSFTTGDFVFKTTRNSISRKSSNSIMQFPVICSNALSADDLMMVTKALEREYAQFIRVAASLDDVIDANDPNAKMKKLQSLHQNIGYRGQSSISFKGGMPSFSESTDLKYTTICEQFRLKNIELLKVVNEDLNMTPLNDLTNKNISNYYKLGEAKLSKEEYENKTAEVNYKNAVAQISRNKEKEKRDIQAHTMKISAERRDRERFGVDMMNTLNTPINQNTRFGDQLLPTDVKKANELVPTMLDLQFIYRTNGGQMMATNIIVGVKTVAHLVTSDEMMTNVATAVKEKRHFFKFLQWTTGEIEGVKDMILSAPKIKEEVKRQRDGRESVWWRRLKGRAASDRLHRATLSKKDVLPNSTLVLTMDEVEMIQNNYNINILKDDRAKRALFNTFFLLGLVIVDPASELVYFAFDGNEDFQVQSYRSLEKETSSAADMKSLISLVDRAGR